MGRRRKKKAGDRDSELAIATFAVVFSVAFLYTRDFVTAIYISVGVVVFAALLVAYFLFLRSEQRDRFGSSSGFSAPPRSDQGLSKTTLDILDKQQARRDFVAPYQPKNTKPDKWSIALIKSLDWKVYEDLCAGYFKAKGRRAEVTSLGADGGIDIFLYKLDEPEKLLGVAQCKAWSKKPIGVREIREFFGVMTDARCPNGIYLTTSSYTSDARAFTEGKRIQLVDTERLLKLILALPDESRTSLLNQATAGNYTTPSCPSCGTKLISRSSSKGKKVGQSFWGCRNFPHCRYTMRQAS